VVSKESHEQDKMKTEGECLLRHTKARMKEKKGELILATGSPGSGKSFWGLRYLELWYWVWFKEQFPVTNICSTLEEAVLIAKDFTRIGEGLLVEELSVLASRRASLTKENRLWNSFLDTVRIKQIVLVGNAPHVSFIDKHFLLLAQIWVDVIGVNFRKGLSIGKPLRLQASPHKSDPYMHKLIDLEGWPVDLVCMRKPSPYIVKFYDEFKQSNTNQLYEDIAEKMVALKKQRRKELGNPILSPREQEAVDLRDEGMKPNEAYLKMGLSEVSIYYKYLRNAMKKT